MFESFTIKNNLFKVVSRLIATSLPKRHLWWESVVRNVVYLPQSESGMETGKK